MRVTVPDLPRQAWPWVVPVTALLLTGVVLLVPGEQAPEPEVDPRFGSVMVRPPASGPCYDAGSGTLLPCGVDVPAYDPGLLLEDVPFSVQQAP